MPARWPASLFLSAMLVLYGCAAPTPAPAGVPASAPGSPVPTFTSAPLAPSPLPVTATPVANDPFTLTSPAFSDGGQIPAQYTYSLTGQCDGDNFSPPLEWRNAPAGVQSFAILVLDPDGGDWLHWLQYNIPASVNSLPEEVGGPDIGEKFKNDFGTLGYGGPCPPGGNHHYIFTLYALDANTSLTTGATRADFLTSIQGHILAQATLTGLRSR